MKSSIGRLEKPVVLARQFWPIQRPNWNLRLHSSAPKHCHSEERSDEEPAVAGSATVAAWLFPSANLAYIRSNAIHTIAITTKQSTLPSGPTEPPLSQSA